MPVTIEDVRRVARGLPRSYEVVVRDLRFNWVEARLDALDEERLGEIVLEAWCMVVPRKVSSGVADEGRDPSLGP